MSKVNREEYEILKGLDGRWKWIARDDENQIYSGEVYIFERKPEREDGYWNNIGNREYAFLRGRDFLFQFIQWEDEKPYNIAELIEEYEYHNELVGVLQIPQAKFDKHLNDIIAESEETEVKKNKEGLVKYLEKEISNFKPGQMIYNYLTFILKQLNQLDEPETVEETTRLLESVLKENKRLGKLLEEKHEEWFELMDEINNQETLSQEWISEHMYYVDDRDSSMVYVSDLQNLLVPKQELPVIPKFVADWIEGNKQFEEKWNDYSKEDAMNDTIHFTIYGLFADYPATNSHVELRKPVLKWLGLDRGNYFKLVNAVRYGYEVEEEQRYYLKIGNLYLAEPLGDMTSDIVRMTRDKGVAYQFTDEKSIATHLDKFEGTEAVKVEELEEC